MGPGTFFSKNLDLKTFIHKDLISLEISSLKKSQIATFVVENFFL
jgi:hypothetical protein